MKLQKRLPPDFIPKILSGIIILFIIVSLKLIIIKNKVDEDKESDTKKNVESTVAFNKPDLIIDYFSFSNNLNKIKTTIPEFYQDEPKRYVAKIRGEFRFDDFLDIYPLDKDNSFQRQVVFNLLKEYNSNIIYKCTNYKNRQDLKKISSSELIKGCQMIKLPNLPALLLQKINSSNRLPKNDNLIFSNTSAKTNNKTISFKTKKWIHKTTIDTIFIK